LPEDGNYKVCIINSQGIVEKYSFGLNRNSISSLSLDALSSGLYIVEVWKDGNCFLRQKIVIN
jgi:hypothetical protein